MRVCVCHSAEAIEDDTDYPFCPVTRERIAVWRILDENGRVVGISDVGCEGIMFDELLPHETAITYADEKCCAWRRILKALREIEDTEGSGQRRLPFDISEDDVR